MKLQVLALLACTLVFTILPTTVEAQYGATGLFYDYTQLSLGESSQFVLIARETSAFRSDRPLQVSVPDAFRLLRENKRSTYGNASLSMSDDDLAEGRVVVHIDPEQRGYFLIVASETVYTFTGLGVTEVMFPGFGDHAWTRDDVPFPAFVMHLPMWRALPPATAHGSVIQLPDGTTLTSADFYARWEAGDSDLEGYLVDYLENGTLVEQTGVLTVLAGREISGARPAVLAMLADGPDSLRLLAIEYLGANANATVLERFAELLESDASAEVRDAVATVLGNSGDSSFAIFDLVHRLEGATEAELPAAIADLAAAGDSRAVDPIVPYLTHASEAVRTAAIDALIGLNAYTRLLVVVENPDNDAAVRVQAAQLVADNASGVDQIAGCVYLISNQRGIAAIEALNSLAASTGDEDHNETVREAIEAQLSHQDAQVRVAAAEAVREIGSSDSLTSISSAVSSEGDSQVTQALDATATALMATLPQDEVRDFADGRDRFLQRAAFRALGTFAQSGRANQATFRALVDGLENTDPGVRGSAILGLSAYANDDAYEAISVLAADADPIVRRDVALGLRNFDSVAAVEQLTTYLDDSDPVVIAAALSSIATQGGSDLLPTVLGLTRASSANVRAAAARAASQLSNPDAEQLVIDALMGAANDDELLVRAAAAESLGRFDNEFAVMGISPLVHDREPTVRLAAISAMGRTGNRAAMRVLVSLLEEREVDIRLASLQALGELGIADAVPEMEAALSREEEPSVLSLSSEIIQALQGQ